MKKTAILMLLLFSDLAFGQATFSPVSVAFPQIAVGGDPGGQNYVTLIQVVNNNSATTTGHLTLFSDSGSALPVLVDGQGPMSEFDIPLQSGETRQIRLTLQDAITPGWMVITYSPSDASTSVILQFRSGETLLSEIGVNPAYGPISSTDFASETDTSLNTGIAIVNPTSTTSYVLARLWDAGSGGLLTSNVVTLPPNGHISKFVNELFPDANIIQSRSRVSLDSCSTAACNFGGGGLLATAVRLNGDQFTTIPVVQRTSDGDQIRYLPQVAFGGPSNGLNMKTVLYFTTNVATGVFGTAEIFDNNGNPLAASADGAPPSSAITVTVAGNRVTRIVLSGDETLRSGWLRLTLPGTVNLVSNAVFQTFIGSTLSSEASVLESPPVNTGLVYVKTQAGAANVGVAFANPDASPNTVHLELFDQAGFVAAAQDVTLPPYGHIAQFVSELFPQIAGLSSFDGALAFTSPTPFSAVALRLTADKIATLPVALDGMYRPAINALRITSTSRSPAEVDFQVDVTDYDADLATAGSPSVAAVGYIDFGSAGYDYGPITIDGTAIADKQTGTLSGSFRPPNVTGAIPAGYQAVFYIELFDLLTNESNVVSIPIRF